MIGRVLIANRGEIAVRILRACRSMGIEAVVAHSEADRDSRAVMMADEAICIGPPESSRSYLSAAAVMDAFYRPATMGQFGRAFLGLGSTATTERTGIIGRRSGAMLNLTAELMALNTPSEA